jgi:riboflavin synthase
VFTGLVSDVGTIEKVEVTAAGRELTVACSYTDLGDGESIAMNGVCLTVREWSPGRFTVGAIETTLARTAIGTWEAGKRVNLERALRLGDRLGGHMVQGHVDEVGKVLSVRQQGDARLVEIEVSGEMDELLVPHGSVTVDGVSLTVNDLPAPGILGISLLDYTLRHTTLGELEPGDAVHVEGDVIGKYVRRLVAPHLATQGDGR